MHSIILQFKGRSHYLLSYDISYASVLFFQPPVHLQGPHYDDVIMDAMASQITIHTIVYSIVYSGADQRKHQSSASLAFVSEIHRWPVNSPHKGPVTRKMFPFDDVTMNVSGYYVDIRFSRQTSPLGQDMMRRYSEHSYNTNMVRSRKWNKVPK